MTTRCLIPGKFFPRIPRLSSADAETTFADVIVRNDNETVLKANIPMPIYERNDFMTSKITRFILLDNVETAGSRKIKVSQDEYLKF